MLSFRLITRDFDKSIKYSLKFVLVLRFTLTSDVSLPLPDIRSSQPVHYSRSNSTDSRRSRVMHQTVAVTDLDGSHPTTTLATTDASRAAARSIGLVLSCSHFVKPVFNSFQFLKKSYLMSLMSFSFM